MFEELNTLIYVRPLNEWQIPKCRHFEVGNFDQEMTLFRLWCPFCRHRVAIEQRLRAQTKAKTSSYCMVKKFLYVVPLPLWLIICRISEIFRFLTQLMESKGAANPFFLLSYVLVFDQLNTAEQKTMFKNEKFSNFDI